MSALDLIDLLENKDLISERRVKKLRQQVNAASKPITAANLAKLLVKNGHLTESQAKKLLQQLEQKQVKPEESDELELLPDEPVQPQDDLIDVDEPVLEEIVDDGDAVGLPVAIPESGDGVSLDDVDAEGADDELFDGKSAEPMDSILDDELGGGDESSVTVGRKKSGLRAMLNLPEKGKRKKYSTNQWDSPLMLAGGGGLLLMIFAAIGLWFYLTRGTGDEAFALAYEDYRNEAYGQAVSKFDRFVSDYPEHPSVSLAKVRIGLARIWSAVDRQRWEDAQQTARTELARIESEEAFGEARDELATILPNIMNGFADQALAAEDVAGAQNNLELARGAFDDVNNPAYMPTSVRQGQQQRIEQILEKLEAVEHRINQDQELVKTVASIVQAASEGRIADAYSLRKTLLKKYPSLEADERLQQVILEVTQRERESVSQISNPPTVADQDHDFPTEYSVVLADRTGENASGVSNRFVIAPVEGAVYGLKAESGEVVWRRYVGLDASFTPLRVSNDPGADVLMVDSIRDELLRVKAATGELVWRLAADRPILTAVIKDGKLFVGFGDDASGALAHINPETGELLGGAEFATGLAAGPVLDDELNVMAQVGSHSSIYLLDQNQWTCQGVHYLGHAEGTIAVPPLAMKQQLVIAENPGPDFSLLHVLEHDPENPGVLRRVVDPIRLGGRVMVEMQPLGNGRILVLTDRGNIHVFKLDPANAVERVQQVASFSNAVPPGTLAFPYFDQSVLWVGDTQLSKFELQTLRNSLARKWFRYRGDVFTAPIHRIGDVLFTVRKEDGRAGSRVTAHRIDSRNDGQKDGEEIWSTDLGVPAAGKPFVDNVAKEIRVVSSNASLYALNGAAIRDGIIDSPKDQVVSGQLPTVRESLPLSNNQWAFFGRPISDGFLLFDPASTANSLSVVRLDLQDAKPSAMPTPFNEGLLVGSSAGPVYWLDANTGQSKAHPFQPSLQPGVEMEWLSPAVTEDGLFVVIADQNGRAYKLTVSQESSPELVASLDVSTEKQLLGPLAVLGESVFATAKDVGTAVMVSFNSADLQVQHEWSLDGEVAWGPKRMGDGVLVATDAGVLIRWGNEPQPTWTVPLPYGPLAGEPLLDGDAILFASVSGIIWKVDAQTGEELAKIDVKEPLGTGPVVLGKRLLVCGGDGTVHIVSAFSNE